MPAAVLHQEFLVDIFEFSGKKHIPEEDLFQSGLDPVFSFLGKQMDSFY